MRGRPPDQGQLRLNEKSEPSQEPGTTDVVEGEAAPGQGSDRPQEAAGSRPGLLLLHCLEGNRDLTAGKVAGWQGHWKHIPPEHGYRRGAAQAPLQWLPRRLEAKPLQTMAQCTQLPSNVSQQCQRSPWQSPGKLTG